MECDNVILIAIRERRQALERDVQRLTGDNGNIGADTFAYRALREAYAKNVLGN
jgi:hypothetical protein